MTSYEFLKGAIAGACGVTISTPPDFFKTILQNEGTLQNIKTYLKPLPYFNKIKYVYRGYDKALYSMMLEKCLVFGGYSYAKKYTNNNFIAGCFAGLLASLTVTPCERLKILYQTNPNMKFSDLKNKKISYYYQGFSATLLREVPGFGIYFYVYEYLKNNYSNNSMYQPFLFGATSGILAWIFIYPQDTIKTIMQSHKEDVNIIKVGKDVIGRGYSNLYKGFSYCLMRIIPLHGTVFMTMEYLNKKI
jgi:solute carrier family 25 carnitine/acylcarnitine transporter 20/29